MVFTFSPGQETRIVMKKLASAVAYMHDHGMLIYCSYNCSHNIGCIADLRGHSSDLVHRDLKLENILLSGCQPHDSLNIKVCCSSHGHVLLISQIH